jgi:hypothetical protein
LRGIALFLIGDRFNRRPDAERQSNTPTAEISKGVTMTHLQPMWGLPNPAGTFSGKSAQGVQRYFTRFGHLATVIVGREQIFGSSTRLCLFAP